jgi:hypothetical protein
VIVLGIAVMGQVDLRGGEAAPQGVVVAVSEAGVAMGVANAPTASSPGMLIGWDRVKSVGGTWAPKAAPFMPLAEQAWRARTRLERGDAVAAEPLFETLFKVTKGQRGPTAQVVAEGLLRCLVRRGAHVAAIDPWLATIDASADQGVAVLHGAWSSDAGLPTVLDPGTGLSPSIPPMWLAWPSVEGYARSSPWMGGGGASKAVTTRVALLANLYHQSAQFEAGIPVNWSEVPTNDPGVQLVAQIVQARIGDAEHRAAARKALLDRIKPPAPGSAAAQTAGPEPWLEAWVHAAVGRSLVLEDSTEQKEAGVLELLQLPARYSAAHPYLTGLALAESAVTLQGMGDNEGAGVLVRELVERYPTHPVQEWQAIRALRPARPNAAPSASGVSGTSGNTDGNPTAGTLAR